jgi:SAM-dependent methyltransferase
VALCQLGLQFFPDRSAALREIRRVLAPGGRFGASVYSSIERNPAADALSSALDNHFGEGASSTKRHEHSLPDRSELSKLLVSAGFTSLRVETVVRLVRFASAEERVRIQFAATPLAALLEGRESSERERLVVRVSADVGADLGPFVQDGGLAFSQEVHVAAATAA